MIISLLLLLLIRKVIKYLNHSGYYTFKKQDFGDYEGVSVPDIICPWTTISLIFPSTVCPNLINLLVMVCTQLLLNYHQRSQLAFCWCISKEISARTMTKSQNCGRILQFNEWPFIKPKLRYYCTWYILRRLAPRSPLCSVPARHSRFPSHFTPRLLIMGGFYCTCMAVRASLSPFRVRFLRCFCFSFSF